MKTAGQEGERRLNYFTVNGKKEAHAVITGKNAVDLGPVLIKLSQVPTCEFISFKKKRRKKRKKSLQDV